MGNPIMIDSDMLFSLTRMGKKSSLEKKTASRKPSCESEKPEWRQRKTTWKSILSELLGCVLLFSSLALFAWLCCVTSGYHWE